VPYAPSRPSASDEYGGTRADLDLMGPARGSGGVREPDDRRTVLYSVTRIVLATKNVLPPQLTA
jgi:hypothetical protein